MADGETEQEESKDKPRQRPPQRGGERLVIESGRVAVIDQFMLANPQLHEARKALLAEGTSEADALDAALQRYGGSSLELAAGTYRVLRDTRDSFLALSPLAADEDAGDFAASEAATEEARELIGAAKQAAKAQSHVFVDTRCLAFIDAGLLADESLLSQLQELKAAGNDKAARDLVRKKGGAVRYGFNKYGDELGAFQVEGAELLALWPDVAD